MTLEAMRKVVKARAGLVLDHPFFGSLALRFRLHEDKGCDTGWTDGVHLGYNPAFVDGLSLDQVKGFIAHEVLHCGLAHQARRQEREPRRWNVAGDFAINPLLVDSGFELPEGVLIDSAFNGMSAEQIYKLIPPQPEDSAGGSSDPGNCGEVRDAKGGQDNIASPAEMRQIEQEWKVAMAQAKQQAKTMGNMPAHLERVVDEIINPKLNWRELLRRFVQRNARNDYRWFPPNRRYVHMNLYLPSLRSDEVGEMVIAVDTSGSIGDDDLKQFAAEISEIMKEFDTNIYVLYCDTEIGNVETFTHEDLPLDLHPSGGGGTDFRPPFHWVADQGIIPACMIYLTDLWCSRYPGEPEYPVLWVHVDDGCSYKGPPFGEVIEMD